MTRNSRVRPSLASSHRQSGDHTGNASENLRTLDSMRPALIDIQHIDRGCAVSARVEGDALAVRAPARRARHRPAELREPHGVCAVGIGHPDFGASRAIRLEHDACAVGRVLRRDLAARGLDQALRAGAESAQPDPCARSPRSAAHERRRVACRRAGAWAARPLRRRKAACACHRGASRHNAPPSPASLASTRLPSRSKASPCGSPMMVAISRGLPPSTRWTP